TMTCFIRDLLCLIVCVFSRRRVRCVSLSSAVGFERWNRMLDGGRSRFAAKYGEGRQGEQADGSADPEGPLEAARERHVYRLAFAGQRVEVRGRDRRCDRDA